MTTPGKDLAARNSGAEIEPFNPEDSAFPVLFDSGDNGGFAEIVRDNFGDEGFSITDLDRIKVPAGGGTAWEIPDEPPTTAFEGVIVHWGTTRAYWEKSLTEAQDSGEDTTPPDCASGDGRLGNGMYGPSSPGNPTGECAECPMNQWQSGRGDSKACKEHRQLWVLRPGAILPIQVSLPPTSLRDFRSYMTRLTGRGIPYFGVVTKFTLRKAKSGANTYGIVQAEKVADLADAERAAAKVYGETIRGYLHQAAQDVANARQTAEGGADPQDPFTDDVPEPSDADIPPEYADR